MILKAIGSENVSNIIAVASFKDKDSGLKQEGNINFDDYISNDLNLMNALNVWVTKETSKSAEVYPGGEYNYNNSDTLLRNWTDGDKNTNHYPKINVTGYKINKDWGQNNNYDIASFGDLLAFCDAVNTGKLPEGKTEIDFTGKTVKLTGEITIESGYAWEPIGKDEANKFEGTFDGQGYEIKGIRNLGGSDLGMFGYIGKDGVVKNLKISGDISGTGKAGAIAVKNEGKIYNCISAVEISASGNYIGGIVGENYGGVENCYVTATVKYTGSDKAENVNAGGIVGYNGSKSDGNTSTPYGADVKNCYYYKTDGAVTKAVGNGAMDCVTSVGYFTGTSGEITKTNGTSLEYGTTLIDALNAWVNANNKNDGNGDNNSDGNAYCNWKKISNEYPRFEIVVEINTAEGLRKVAQDVNNGDTFSGKMVKLVDNIELGNVAWTPIGTEKHSFKGTFDGNGKTISGVYINGNEDYQGLFGYVENAGIQNLTVEGSITGRNEVGGVVGCAVNSEISGCTNKVTVTASGDDVGGVVGQNNGGTVQNCTNKGIVTNNGRKDNEKTWAEACGGVVGWNTGDNAKVTGCTNEGDVTGYRVVGGVVGENDSLVENCHNTATVKPTEDGYAGGVVAWNNGGTISNCYNTGAVDGSGSTYVYTNEETGETYYGSGRLGGIVGGADGGEVYNCYNRGEIKGHTSVGGIAGSSSEGTEIYNCYNTGTVTAKDIVKDGNNNKNVYVGGMVGENNGKLYNGYNIGDVITTLSSAKRGGVVGANGSTGEVYKCYFLKNGDLSSYGVNYNEVDSVGYFESTAANISATDGTTLAYTGTLDDALNAWVDEKISTNSGLKYWATRSNDGTVIFSDIVISVGIPDNGTYGSKDATVTLTVTNKSNESITIKPSISSVELSGNDANSAVELKILKDNEYDEIRVDGLIISKGSTTSFIAKTKKDEKNPINAGEYITVINVDINGEEVALKKRVTLTVNKAELNITASDKTITYTGATYDLSNMFEIKEELELGSATKEYLVSDEYGSIDAYGKLTIKKAGEPITIKLKVTTDETSNYESSTQTATLTVNKGTQTISGNDAVTVVYNKEKGSYNIIGTLTTNASVKITSYTVQEGESFTNEDGTLKDTVEVMVTAEETLLYAEMPKEKVIATVIESYISKSVFKRQA